MFWPVRCLSIDPLLKIRETGYGWDANLPPFTGRAAAPMSSILADACVVTVNSANEVHELGSVFVRDDRIADIGSKAELIANEPSAEVIDCGSNILIPGIVNTHTHLFQTLLKGPGAVSYTHLTLPTNREV